MVCQKLTFRDPVEGICDVDTDWTGSGHVKKASATLDASTVEVTGTPGEYANVSILQTDVVTAIISEMTTEVESRTKEKRVPTFTGKASELRRGAAMVSVSGRAYFEDETMANLMDNATVAKLQTVLTSPDGVFHKLYPQVKYEVEDWERTEEGLFLPFKAHAFKKTAAVTEPIQFMLINGTASY